MEKTRYLTAAKPITPGKRDHHQEKENNCGEKINLTWGEEKMVVSMLDAGMPGSLLRFGRKSLLKG